MSTTTTPIRTSIVAPETEKLVSLFFKNAKKDVDNSFTSEGLLRGIWREFNPAIDKKFNSTHWYYGDKAAMIFIQEIAHYINQRFGGDVTIGFDFCTCDECTACGTKPGKIRWSATEAEEVQPKRGFFKKLFRRR